MVNNYSGPERRRNLDQPDNDHDLLINIHNKLNNLADLSDQNKEEYEFKHDDHEKRIRWIERMMLLGMGGLFMLQFFLKFGIK